MRSFCRSPIIVLMEGQHVPQSAAGEAKVITLCGSTKFDAEFVEVNQRLTMEGCVVIGRGMFSLPDLPDYVTQPAVRSPTRSRWASRFGT